MSIEAWPFLISRNKTLDYSVIVAPDLIEESDLHKLIHMTDGDMTATGTNVWRQMDGADNQMLTLVFRIEQAWINGERARDGFGRLIVQIIGFVLNSSEKESPVADEVFKMLKERVRPSYQEFWDRSEHLSAAYSEPFYLSFDKVSHKLILISPEELQDRSELSVTNRYSMFSIMDTLATLKERFAAFFRSP